MVINFCVVSSNIKFFRGYLGEIEYMYGTQPEIYSNNAAYYACLCYKMNFWCKMFIAKINIFEVSGVDSSKRHYSSVINILWFTFKFQNTTKCYFIQKLFFLCVCVWAREREIEWEREGKNAVFWRVRSNHSKAFERIKLYNTR